MKENSTLKKIENGQQVLGTFLEINDTTVVEALGVSDLDFLVVDMEHGSFSTESLEHIIQAADLRGTTPMVRIKNISRSEILRPLDIGAQGLIIPNIHSVEEVEQIVEWAKYKPLGNRGFFTSRVTDFGLHEAMQDLDGLFEDQNRQTLVLPQCETIESLEVIEEIVGVDGVSGIFIGPFDLSIALGIPTQFDHPKFKEAIARIYKACRDQGKFAFIFANDIDTAKYYFNYGFDSVTYSLDINLLIQSVQQVVQELR